MSFIWKQFSQQFLRRHWLKMYLYWSYVAFCGFPTALTHDWLKITERKLAPREPHFIYQDIASWLQLILCFHVTELLSVCSRLKNSHLFGSVALLAELATNKKKEQKGKQKDGDGGSSRAIRAEKCVCCEADIFFDLISNEKNVSAEVSLSWFCQYCFCKCRWRLNVNRMLWIWGWTFLLLHHQNQII